ncbi:MAG: Ig-like domain-containing protein [Lentimicrobiaceae bacterium]|nr:Ig-like domain-containing protein [Lentimicrobiaceae bacterium]
MKRTFFFIGIIVIFFFAACNKPKVTCEIISPLPNTTFELDDIIELVVNADATNTTILEVQVYLDNVGYASKEKFPYNFQINTYNLEEGTHTIRAVAIAEDGTNSEAKVSFILVKYESPDFVTFSNGQFPLGWKKGAWQIFSPGFDDDYSIRTFSAAWGELTTIKTGNADIDCIEFYAKDDIENWYSTELSFYIDDHLIKTIKLAKSWEKYTFEMQQGVHTYRWWITGAGSSCYSYLDAIRFFKKQKGTILTAL